MKNIIFDFRPAEYGININHKARSMGGQTNEIVLRYDPMRVEVECG